MRNIRKGMLLLRKGHLDQLENSEYLSPTDAERGQLKDIRLLANRTRNKIPNDPQQVRFLTRSRGQTGSELGQVSGAWVP
jgi:hypothetical protein